MALSWDPEGTAAEDELLVRPFLTRSLVGYRPRPGRSCTPARPGGGHAEVRPYLLTGGRTHRRSDLVAIETVVVATGYHLVRIGEAAAAERARILRLARGPCSVAELAAWLNLPLQVVLVLVSDLIADGLLDASDVSTRQSDDVLFLERLIAGVARL